MLKLSHFNSKPCGRTGILRLRLDNFGDDIFNVVVSIRALDPDFFKGSLREKSQILGDLRGGRSKIIKIPYATSFPTGTAEFSASVSYSKSPSNVVRALEIGAFSLQIKDLSNQITNTTYHIENKNVLHSEGHGIAYLGGDNSTNIPTPQNQDDAEERECRIDLSVVDESMRGAPSFLCEIESAKRLQAGKINFVRLNFISQNTRDVDAFDLVKVAGQVDMGEDVESFFVEKFSTNDGISLSGRVKINIPESATQISLGNFIFEVSRNGEIEHYASSRNFECFFEVRNDAATSDFDDFYNLPLRVETNPVFPERATPKQKENPQNFVNDSISNQSPYAFNKGGESPLFSAKIGETVAHNPAHSFAPNYAQQNFPQPTHIVQPIYVQAQVPPQMSMQGQVQMQQPQVGLGGGQQVAEPQQSLAEILEKADIMFGDGENVRDEKSAFELYEKATKIGSPIADYKLGECYLRGIGTKANAEKAFRYFKLAADKDIAEATFRCYECAISGTGVERNASDAIRYLRAASSLGCVKAKGILAQRFLLGEDCEQDYASALNLANDGLKNGDVNSIYVLAYMYYFGVGTNEDFSKAAIYSEIASAAGHFGASYIYAECLRRGVGIEKNIEKAETILRKVVKDGDSSVNTLALDSLGTILEESGKKEEATDCFAKAAQAGYLNALFKLAKIISIGDGIPASPTTAFAMFSLVAKSGNIDATLELAESYLRGRGVSKNDAEAYKLANSVLASGNPHALYLVGMMKITGKGTTQDAANGRELLKKSASAGFEPAQKCLTRLGG